MSIVFNCPCGTTLKAKEEDRGKKTKCPKCGKVLVIPAAEGAKTPVMAGAAATSGSANPAISDPNAIAVDMNWPDQDSGQIKTPDVSSTEAATQIQIDAAVADRIQHDPLDDTRPTDGTPQYKVLTPKDYGLPGKFNPPKLEEHLNLLARKGWTVKSSVVIHVHSHSGHHDELVVILER